MTPFGESDGGTDTSGDALVPADATPVAPGPMTSTILAYNPGATAANAVLHIYDTGGTEVSHTATSIAAQGVVVVPMPAGLPYSFLGTGMLTSDARIETFTLDANATNAARDLADSAPAPSTELTFPIFRHDGAAAGQTIVSVQNTDPTQTATVKFHYYDQQGNELSGSPVVRTIAPLGSSAFDSLTLFGTILFAGTARVESTLPVVASEQIMFMLDTGSLRGLADSEAATSFELNWVEQSSTKWSEIYVTNRDTNPATVTVKYYTTTGASRATDTQTILANGSHIFNTNNPQVGAQFSGYATVTQTGSSPLMVSGLNMENTGKILYAYHGVPQTRATAIWACGDVQHIGQPAQFTTFKIVNADPGQANIVLSLFDPATGQRKLNRPYKLAVGTELSIITSDAAFNPLGKNYVGLGTVQATNGARVLVTGFNSYGSGGITSFTCTSSP